MVVVIAGLAPFSCGGGPQGSSHGSLQGHAAHTAEQPAMLQSQWHKSRGIWSSSLPISIECRDKRGICSYTILSLTPNATLQAPPIAGATQERRLLAVA